MKRILYSLLVFFLIIAFIYLMTISNYECPIKKFLHINCLGCGLSKSFISILKLDFIQSIKYNVLGIPLFIFMIYFTLSIIKDIILNNFITIPKILKFLSNNYILLIISISISYILNLI